MDSREEVTAATDAAIEQVRRGATEQEIVNLRKTCIDLAQTRETFTTDSVWERSETEGWTIREPRALGAIMREIQQAGMIVPTNTYQPSGRVRCHGRPVRVWKSLRYPPTPDLSKPAVNHPYRPQ